MAGVYWILSTGNFYVIGMLTGSGNLLGGNYQKKCIAFLVRDLRMLFWYFLNNLPIKL